MPMVKGKKFPYTKAGIKAAKKYKSERAMTPNSGMGKKFVNTGKQRPEEMNTRAGIKMSTLRKSPSKKKNKS